MALKTFYFEKFGPQLFGEHTFSAYQGIMDLGFDSSALKFFDDIEKVPVSLDIKVTGCIESERTYLEKLGVTLPPALNVPDVLMPMLGRRLEVMSIEDFFEKNVCPAFVKPLDLKACKAGVIQSDSMKRLVLADAPAGIKLLVGDVIDDIVNEYRVFVNRGECIGIRQYGMVSLEHDHFIYPDKKIIWRFVDEYVMSGQAPISFTADFGVGPFGKTVLIECNDGWAVSSYGLDSELYAKFLLDRWNELLMKNRK